MTFKELLNKDAIFLDIEEKNHDDVLLAISKRLQEKGFVEDAQRFDNALMYREELMSTCLNDGMAIPHGVSSTVIKPVISIAVLKNSVDWKAEDKEPVSLVFTIALSKEDRDLQISSVQILSLYSLDDEFHVKVLGAKTQEDVYQILLDHYPEEFICSFLND
ncbi:PTS sugar transporter subunit IIA [Mycoplasma sp. Ms02]|uniref:PTS sugar transporter subunit IIA n=1 Tax=Mycoplasma sp. Ms02 TaxID=353851 RepID=UPI001C88F964|nr:PTS sugar transporter subunit IIA [Mycoplasma sp. Ms02]QZE12369.1 PTS sugar transporter subunit IIA [Mycoplasma sp. Ms02]